MDCKIRKLFIFVTCFLILQIINAHDFTTQCPKECRCIWVSGNKEANCVNSSLAEIPKTLSSDIQNLILTGNNLYEIEQYAFQSVGLSNLKKLVLRDCKLQEIHKGGFSGLNIMIQLDLTNNEIKYLHPDTFKDLNKIRWIQLTNNLLTRLDDGLFNHLLYLQKLYLNDNRIVQIGVNTFQDVPTLRDMDLSRNKLEYLKVDTFKSVKSLTTLELNKNPWRCDCFLQPFRNWVNSNSRFTSPTCAEPPTLSGKSWVDLDTDDFACKPKILYPPLGTTIRASNANTTLSCQVTGNPLPEVSWVLNSKIIDGSDTYRRKYILVEGIDDNNKWLNLTITNIDGSDNGDYLCAAKNPGGVEEKKISLYVTHMSTGIKTPAVIEGNMMPVLIGISCSAAILLILLIILCYCCCRRRHSEKKKADNSNGEALIEGSVIPEMEKSLINTINPVTKPPRRYDAPPSITSGGTEMSELNKTLLDIDSVYNAAHDEEKHSLDFEIDPSKRSNEMLNYGRHDVVAYPPDLLSFPTRAPQISPAASSASTVPDTTRLPAQLNPASPIHSPIYSTNPNLFRTLPYSRSQSPFTAPITPPVVTPRQGYVTIPRRPRIPSWSSTASTQILPSSEAQEPLYDNLGLRTTANGSSVLSLNKTGLEQPLSPMRGRPLPATPALMQSPHTIYYTPIEEQHAQILPMQPLYATNPRNSVASQLSAQLSIPGPQEPVNPRISWASKKSSTPIAESRKVLFPGNETATDLSTMTRRGNKPETGSLRRNPKMEIRDDIPSPKTSPNKDDTRNEHNLSLNQSGTLGRSGKIPPRPPPKPKKKPSVDSNDAILFEDEGEDGTEV